MSDVSTVLPPRRGELVFSRSGDGPCVVKVPRTGEYYNLGPEESFLLRCLDGQQTAESICAAFTTRFDEPLTAEELDSFLELAEEQGLLAGESPRPVAECFVQRSSGDGVGVERSQQWSLLCWRQPLFDPDRLFTWAAPKLWFFWTRAFLFVSALCIVVATCVVATSTQQIASSFSAALQWQTLFFVWLTLLTVTTLHEFAHGLTCKHHGGEVHEIGFLMLLLMPCFYCDVSDAWLFREKSKRLWVTLAGGLFEFWLWALAVLAWRVTPEDSLVNYLAFVVFSVCGVQTLFNFNPLLKLDGYYLLSDWLEIPNLHERGWEYVKRQVRRFLWGAPAGETPASWRLLLAYGAASWLASFGILALMLIGIFQLLHARWPAASWGVVALASMLTMPGLFRGTSAGEVRRMLWTRHLRTLLWLGGIVAVGVTLAVVEVPDRAKGKFLVCPAARSEVCAPQAGFIESIYVREGDRIAPGDSLARLDVPDLASRLRQKGAQVREARACLRLLEAGTRLEERNNQRQRVERAELWRDLAKQDLARTRQALEHNILRLDGQIAQFQAEVAAAQDSYARAESIGSRGGMAKEQIQEIQRRYRVAQAQLRQSQAEKAALESEGTLAAETELARRERELAEGQAILDLLEAGARPEQIEAERARLARLDEEYGYLAELQCRLDVVSRVSGIITTPHLEDRVGQFVSEGVAICVIEQVDELRAEVSMSEQDSTRVKTGQSVVLKARGLPFETFRGRVERTASRAEPGTSQSNLIIYCCLDASSSELRPGMSGHARVSIDRRPIGTILLDRIVRFLRTEFWW